MNKQQAENLINHVAKNYNVEGSVYVDQQVRNHRYNGENNISEVFSCSVFITRHSIERMEANTFYNLCRLVTAKLSAMGLDK